MKLEFTREARADLVAIRDWIKADNAIAAQEVIARIRQTAELLAGFPRMGRTGRAKGTREFPVTGLPYTIIYAVEGETLTILAVLHQSRRYPA